MKPLSNKIYYILSRIYILINAIFCSYRINHLKIISNPIVTFGKEDFSLVLCNTSHVDCGNKHSQYFQELTKNKLIPYMSVKNDLNPTSAAYGQTRIKNWE